MNGPSTRLSEAFEAHAGRLFAYARRQVGPNEAEDLVSDAFVVALSKIDDLPDDSREAYAWLVGTVRKLAANARRRKATHDKYWRDAIRDGWHATAQASHEDAVAEREQCLAALARLSVADRELLLLTAWDGLSPEQAAAVLGISRRTLAVRLHRARHRLADHIDPTEPALQALPVTE